MAEFFRAKMCGYFIFVALVFFGQTALADHYLVGRWLDQTEATEAVIEIYMEDGDYFMFKKMPQGKTASKRVERKVADGVMTFRTLDKNYLNKAYAVNRKARQLSVIDKDGQVVATPKLLDFEPEPEVLVEDDEHHGEKDDHHD